ncbi:MAG: multiheme c-type cytochrome [Blastocatellia bacterium]|nr:multiheme c-type cytochrome [Blastocatellia bacterium]
MTHSIKKTARLVLVGLALCAALMPASPGRGVLGQAGGKAGPGAKRFAGSQACLGCHQEIVEKQRGTAMGAALEKVGECRVLRSHPELKFQQGKYRYRIQRQGDQSLYTVSDDRGEFTAPILYCFGQGKSGQTYVYEYKGERYESRVSFYLAIDGLDITLGHSPEAPRELVEAAGRRMSVDETTRCFGCHTTGEIPRVQESGQLQLDHLSPGVGCETCHGPAERHVAFMKSGQTGDPAGGRMKKLSALDGDDVSQTLCAACHRSAEDIMELPARGGINNVRFQPYRIFNSRCYSADARIGCTACHDPHGTTETAPAFYDAKCQACHQAKAASGASAARVCKVGRENCAGCHMPKIDLPGAHFKFTDHRIRIVREGAPYPN